MDTTHPILNTDVQANIEVTARSLIGQFGFTHQDLPDIEQELTRELLEKLPCFDEARASFNTFQQVVISRYANQLLRRRQASKRQEHIPPLSLDQTVPMDSGEDVSMEATIDGDDVAIRMGWRSRSRHEVAVLRSDVAAVLETLPELQRECCLGIMDGQSVSELARNRSMPANNYRRNVFTPLRRAFTAAGLHPEM